MTFQEFVRYHMPALEADEVRFNVQIAVMAAAAKDFPAGFQYWTLGAPGHCALFCLPHSIATSVSVLRARPKTFPIPASWEGTILRSGLRRKRAYRASLSTFQAIEQQRIHALTESPLYPGAEGAARLVSHRCGRATAFRMDDRVSPRSYSLRSTAAMGEG